MSNVSRSPKKNTFGKESYLKHRAEEGRTPENDDEVKAMIVYMDESYKQEDEKELDPNWKINNLEYDLRTTDWILEKTRKNKSYAQNLYAALCNNDFQKLDVFPILKEERWSCSWRHAGGIIADMVEEGDYIDWYCSGIQNSDDNPCLNYIAESDITDEIRADLKTLGWAIIKYEDE